MNMHSDYTLLTKTGEFFARGTQPHIIRRKAARACMCARDMFRTPSAHKTVAALSWAPMAMVTLAVLTLQTHGSMQLNELVRST